MPSKGRMVGNAELEASIHATFGMAMLAEAPILIIVGEAGDEGKTKFALDFRSSGLSREDWGRVLVGMGQQLLVSPERSN